MGTQILLAVGVLFMSKEQFEGCALAEYLYDDKLSILRIGICTNCRTRVLTVRTSNNKITNIAPFPNL